LSFQMSMVYLHDSSLMIMVCCMAILVSSYVLIYKGIRFIGISKGAVTEQARVHHIGKNEIYKFLILLDNKDHGIKRTE
jgi:hypothetical protein